MNWSSTVKLRGRVMPFCPVCGAEVSEVDEFCAKCGAALREGRARYAREEKREKQEKGEKREKGEKAEKHEKEARGVAPIIGGVILIYLGITFYLVATNVVSWEDWWSYFLLGLGGILIVQALLISVLTKMRAYGFLIGGGVLCLIGASGILGIRDWWWLILVAIGLAMILSTLRERRRTPRP